jgi:hypothetical protein
MEDLRSFFNCGVIKNATPGEKQKILQYYIMKRQRQAQSQMTEHPLVA